VSIIVLSAIYGAIMGLYPSGLQILYDAVKIPMLLLISLLHNCPSFYVLTSLLEGKRSLSQVVVLLLSSLTVMSTILMALVPANLFLVLTTADATYSTYAFLILLNVLIFCSCRLVCACVSVERFYGIIPRWRVDDIFFNWRFHFHVCWNTIGMGCETLF